MSKASKERRKLERLIEFAPEGAGRKTKAEIARDAPAPVSGGRRVHARAGTRVAIIREAHGWHDGSVTGVLIDDSGGVRVDADDPHFANVVFQCPHRRDYYVLT